MQLLKLKFSEVKLTEGSKEPPYIRYFAAFAWADSRPVHMLVNKLISKHHRISFFYNIYYRTI
jgi:hypothetical protein